MEFKGSRTEANLQAAFAGESQARNKYTYYAGIAKKEGYNQHGLHRSNFRAGSFRFCCTWFRYYTGILPAGSFACRSGRGC